LQNWANEIMRQTGSRKPVCVALAGLSGVDSRNGLLLCACHFGAKL